MKKVDNAEAEEEAENVAEVVLAVRTTDEKVGGNLPRLMETNLVQFIKAQTINERIAPIIWKVLTSREVMNNNNRTKEEDNILFMEADLAVTIDTVAVEEFSTNNTTSIILIHILINNNNNIPQMILLLTIRQRLAIVVTVQEVLPYHNYLKQAIKAIIINNNFHKEDLAGGI